MRAKGTSVLEAMGEGVFAREIACAAASRPSWNGWTSIEVKAGEVRRAKIELLKETMETSFGISSPASAAS